MRKFILIIIIVVVSGCKNKADLELEIITKEVNYFLADNYKDYTFGTKPPPVGSKTIITYKLTNTTNTTYYFNITDINQKEGKDNYVQLNKAFIRFYDKDNNPAYVRSRQFLENTPEMQYTELLGYNVLQKNSFTNFTIHPNETLYFEWFLVLPFGTLTEENKYFVKLDENKKYYAELFINSDTINIKNKISRTDKRMIEENKYKVFTGILKSKNRVPVKFNNLK
ncbi:hypothetical protein CHU92_06615 [Flavobacterium cyanobacteriorum]|uniref:Lipoprotein n=1 Tax=Flavobacterium cyanobacteriorum TaxID=2022802 RepID=A0A255ZB44_9FLAO|nr:hypothetical protein [Flavobacterium cyanobacteriorum]OYQ38085.1 hypothetical protein CHU92_06615 [Flavobacterium cyanobacteriorum]